MQVTRVTGTLVNGAVLAIAAALGLWSEVAPGSYYAVVQEDGPVEWGTFWAFAAAAGLAVRELVVSPGRQRWGLAAVATLCAFIALEEISWGQRLLGYRPPVYFLEHNFQQELNVHNVASRSARKLAVQALIAGYGVVLPLLCTIPRAARLAIKAFHRSAPVPGVRPSTCTEPLITTSVASKLVEVGCLAWALSSRLLASCGRWPRSRAWTR